MLKLESVILGLIILISIISCKKEGVGGESEIAATIIHHGDTIPGATVYIKYGAKEFPGDDMSKYDDSKVSGTAGYGKGHVHFIELVQGDYYLYAVGVDSALLPGNPSVRGGIHVEIKKHDHKEVVIPVGEE